MVRTWVRALGAALLAAVVTGAGQLGVAYGLGILRWGQELEDDRWRAHLAWAAFIAALAVVGGAVGGVRALRRHGVEDGFGAWIAVSLAALVGAAVTVPLVGLPAREAGVAAHLDPALNAALAAGLGVAFGFFAALAVLCARPVAGSVSVTAAWVWLVALVSAFSRLTDTAPPRGQRLGVVDVPILGQRDVVLPVMIGLALLAGAVIAAYARWLDEHPAAVAASGLAGPALVAAAYIVAGPGTGRTQERAWLGALIAVGAGLVASVLVAVIRRHPPAPTTTESTAAGPPATDTAAAPPPRPATAPVVAQSHDEYEKWVSGLGDDEPTDDLPPRKHRSAREPDDPTETIGAAGTIPPPRQSSLGRPYVSPGRE